METSLTFLQQTGHGPAALRIQPPAREDRTPTHFIGLIDISESMSDTNKLMHVKHCMSLLLKFLTPADELSIITFGEESQIVLKRGSGDAGGAAAAEASIRSLWVNGCTNLSAGLASVRELLDDVRGSGSTLKQSLLVLTDGHANRGVSGPVELRAVASALREAFPTLSISYVAYGTDHNAELLKGMAEDAAGSYSIVENLEGAALVMGEALGAAISCVAQNVVVELPAGTTAEGPHRMGSDGRLTLGDLYAGNEMVLLLEMPGGVGASAGGPVRVRGMSLPTLQPFSIEVTDQRLETARNIEIDLTRLRYRCSDLFRRLRQDGATDELRADITAFATSVRDEAFNGHAVGDMLRMELVSLEEALRAAGRSGRHDTSINAQMLSHEMFTAYGRGITQQISSAAAPLRPTRSRAVRFATAAPLGGGGTPDASDDEVEDPRMCSAGPPRPVPPRPSYLSPTSSVGAQRVAIAMRSLSQQVEEEQVPAPAPVAPGAPPPTPSRATGFLRRMTGGGSTGATQ